jgi:RNA polymerase sporulation-specific sigma factor
MERLVRMVVRKFVNSGVNEDDLFQEGCVALLKAQNTYTPDKGVKFETYASKIIRNRLIDVLRSKHHNTVEAGTAADTATGRSLEDEVDIIERNDLIKRVLSKCTEIERAIFNAYFGGYSYDEIGKIFNINNKKIDNTIQKIKKIIKLEDEY